MLERFSARARLAIERAEEEARRLRHPHIGTEHLLLGLLCGEGDPAAETLVAAGATLDGARQKASEAVGQTSVSVAAGELPMTARARRALERASRFSLQRRDDEVGTEHVLLGVLDVEGRAGQVLRGLGVDVVRLRAAVDLDRLDTALPEGNGATASSSAPADAAGAGSGSGAAKVSPRCPSCGADVESALGHRLVNSRGDAVADRRLMVVFCSACGSVLGIT